MPDNPQNNMAAAVIEAMEKYYAVKPLELMGEDDAPIALAVPRGVELKSVKPLLDEYLMRPQRKRGTATIHALDSLIAHVNRFKTKWSAAFVMADPAPSITVVYDYHEANVADADAGVMLGEPDWCQHRAHYSFPLSEEWCDWARATDAMNQASFAAFIEDRLADVQDPSNATQSVIDHAEQLGIALASPSQLMAISRSLSIRVECKAAQAINLTSGETQVVFEEEHKDASYGPVKVPGAFANAIPVFKLGALYSVAVRLRYRLQDRKVYWWVSLHNTERIIAHAIAEACTKFTMQTEVPIFYGAPEKG